MTTEFYGDQNFDWTHVDMCGMFPRDGHMPTKEEARSPKAVNELKVSNPPYNFLETFYITMDHILLIIT